MGRKPVKPYQFGVTGEPLAIEDLSRSVQCTTIKRYIVPEPKIKGEPYPQLKRSRPAPDKVKEEIYDADEPEIIVISGISPSCSGQELTKFLDENSNFREADARLSPEQQLITKQKDGCFKLSRPVYYLSVSEPPSFRIERRPWYFKKVGKVSIMEFTHYAPF
jgi:hypothetical protein